jgi:hypothetical protein
MKSVLMFKYINDDTSITDIEFYYVTLLANGTIQLPDDSICSKCDLLENHFDMFYDIKTNEIHLMNEYEEMHFVLDKLKNNPELYNDKNEKSIKYFVLYNYQELQRRHESFISALHKNKIMF